MTTKDEIKGWLIEGKEKGATHVIVVCDTYEWDDYPVFVMPNEKVLEKKEEYDGKNMQKIMEVYNLSLDFQSQLDEIRSFHIDI